MLRKVTGMVVLVFLFSLLTVNLGSCDESSSQVSFNYSELSASISVSSPVKNSTYSNNSIEVKADVYIGGHDYVKDSHYIPYQNINCVYSLDGFEWQNMTLAFTSQPYIFPSLVNNYWYVTMWLNYTAVLHNVTEGQHNLEIDLNPEGIRSREEGGEG